MPADERSHNRIVSAVVASTPGGLAGDTLARLEGRHRGGGNALRAAVLGANDGLVSNLCLVMGVAGASAVDVDDPAHRRRRPRRRAPARWRWANGCRSTSARELNEKQIAVEADELEHAPEEEKEELILIYQAKGLSEAEARALADRLMADQRTALDTLAREELGIDPAELGGSAWVAASTSFALFAAGAIVPVVPYLFLSGTQGLDRERGRERHRASRSSARARRSSPDAAAPSPRCGRS